jgi:hypothetical protein
MLLFWLQSTMGLLASLCTSRENVNCLLPTARATSSLQADKKKQQHSKNTLSLGTGPQDQQAVLR